MNNLTDIVRSTILVDDSSHAKRVLAALKQKVEEQYGEDARFRIANNNIDYRNPLAASEAGYCDIRVVFTIKGVSTETHIQTPEVRIAREN